MAGAQADLDRLACRAFRRPGSRPGPARSTDAQHAREVEPDLRVDLHLADARQAVHSTGSSIVMILRSGEFSSLERGVERRASCRRRSGQ